MTVGKTVVFGPCPQLDVESLTMLGILTVIRIWISTVRSNLSELCASTGVSIGFRSGSLVSL